MSLRVQARPKKFRRQTGGTLAEFGPVLLILFIFLLFPLIDLFSLCGGVATIAFMANWAAHSAGVSTSATDAQNAVTAQVNNIITSFGGLSGITTKGGTTSLAVIAVPVVPGAATNVYTALPLNSSSVTVDPRNFIYEYQVTCNYGILPLLNFANSGIFSGVPFLGAPVNIQFVANSNVEHPNGLTR